jgi:hypothetical protein
MAINWAVYQPIQEKSLYESFLEARNTAIKRQQLQMQQDADMDEYAASIMRDPNFSKDSPYNPYINQKLQETLNNARLLYQSGALNTSTFKSYVATQVGKINLWVQNADQIMNTIDEGVAYYKTKGADVSSIRSRAARNIFMDEKGNWRDGDAISQMMQGDQVFNAVNTVVETNPALAFKDTKAIDDWLTTFKTEKENITRQSTSTTGGAKGRASTGASIKGVAEYYPSWQEVERNASGIPIGVKEKPLTIEQIRTNDAVYLSAKGAVYNQRLNSGQWDDPNATDKKITVSDQEIVNYVTQYANQKRPFNFTKDEEKTNTYITYKTSNTYGSGDNSGGEDYNIFNATLTGKMPSSNFFDGSGDVVTLKPTYLNQLKLGETTFAGTKVPIYATSMSLDKKNKTLTVVSGGQTQTYKAGEAGYGAFMTQLKVLNPGISEWGSSNPQLNPKRSGFKTNIK